MGQGASARLVSPGARQALRAAERLPLLDIAGSVACLVPYMLLYGMRENFFQHVFTVI
jgi:hypothetical protein